MRLEDWQFKVPNISKIDGAVLADEVKGQGGHFEEPTRVAGAHSELATLIVVGGISILSTMANYYFGKRKTKTAQFAIEVVKPDGTRINLYLKVFQDSMEPVENQIKAQLEHLLESSA